MLNKKADLCLKKAALHGIKHPGHNCFGALIGSPHDSQPQQITDIVPLFHQAVMLPPLEVALELIASWCDSFKDKRCIIGFYQIQSFGLKRDEKISLILKECAKGLIQSLPKGKKKQGPSSSKAALESAVMITLRINDSERKYDMSKYVLKTNGALIDKETELVDVDETFKPDSEFYAKFTDFDDYFEDVSRDWTNSFLNS